MTADRLEELLRGAEAGVEPVRLGGDLAERVRVRGRARRRRRRGRVVMAGVTVVVVAAMGWAAYWLQGGAASEKGRVEGATVAQVRAEVARLEREAERLEGWVKRYDEMRERVRERRAKRRRWAQLEERNLRLGDPLMNVRKQAERAAGTMMKQAQQRCGGEELCAAARGDYERVIKLFPETRWAEVAERRLEAIIGVGKINGDV